MFVTETTVENMLKIITLPNVLFMAERSTDTPDSLFNTEYNLMQLKQVEYHLLSIDQQNLLTHDGNIGCNKLLVCPHFPSPHFALPVVFYIQVLPALL